MDKNNVVSTEIVRRITRVVVEELQKQQRLERSTPIGVSNRHVHLDRADMDALFGPGSELTVKKMLGQPGQYAAEETVTIRGPKGELSRVRVLGPLRSQTQVESIIQMGNDYLRIVTIGSLGMFCQIMYERLLQGTGRSLLSMYTQGLGAIINIILDPIFIFGLKMGVAGAAVATIIGQFCGFALAVWFNHRKNTDITLSLRGFRPDFRLIGEIYAIGLPSVIMIAIGSVMTFLMNKILITYHAAHETAATAFGVYFKLNSFIFMPIFGLNNGVIPIVAYNYGAQNRRRMMATIKRSTLYACCIMVFGTVLFWAIPDTLLRLFDASDVMLAAGVPALRIIALSFCMAGMCIALGSSFQALGKSMYSMVTSIVRQLVFLVPIAYVLARYGAAIGNSDLVWWCYPIAEVSSLLLTLVFFRHIYKTVIAPIPEGHE